jgi:uncharacterized protein
MRGFRSSIAIGAAVVVAGAVLLGQQGGGRAGRGGASVLITPGEECPEGMTEVRPGRCQAPEMPPPSIVDYRPRSTVVAKEHLVPKAKFPVVDIHSHERIRPDNMAQRIQEMDALNLRVLVNLTAGSGEELRNRVDIIRTSPHPDRFRVFANVNWNGAGGPGWKEKEVAALEQAVRDGAIGLKVAKNLGLAAKKADGSRLKVDDPDLDPIWALCARLNIPVLIHIADPAQFFEPIDYKNERWLELGIYPTRAYPPDRYPRFEELIGERDRMFARHRKTRFINAHFGWHGNDFGRASRLMDTLPNMYMEVGAVLYEFGRQPRAAREFFTKYQDRVLFGKDAYEPTEYPYFWRVFETQDEYFDYYRDYHAHWKLYGMGLPDPILKKLYYQNALKVAPGLPQTGWPK